MAKPDDKSPFGRDSAESAGDVRARLDEFETAIAELKVEYEQFFSGLLPIPPEKSHNEIKRLQRNLRRAPFKNSAMNYRLRMLEMRLASLNTYWQRVMREREAGTYRRDVFKAQIRDKKLAAEAHAKTGAGKAEQAMKTLFNSYKEALEKQAGGSQNISFESFERSLIKRAKEFKEKHPGKRVSFKVVVKDGKVSLQASAKDPAKPKS